MEKQLNGRIAELEAECARLQSEAAKAAKLEAELAEEKQRAQELEKQLRGRIEELERRSAEADALEKDLARVRQEFEDLRQGAEALLSKLEGFVGKDANQIAQEAENKRAAMEKQLTQTQAMLANVKQESKEKRAALVDNALKSMLQLSHHMVWMLAGLRLNAPNDPPFQVKSLNASPSPSPRKMRDQAAGSPSMVRKKKWLSETESLEAGSPPLLCQKVVQVAQRDAVVTVEHDLTHTRARMEVIAGDNDNNVFIPRPPSDSKGSHPDISDRTPFRWPRHAPLVCLPFGMSPQFRTPLATRIPWPFAIART